MHRIFGSSKTASANASDSPESRLSSSQSQVKKRAIDSVLIVGLGNPGKKYETTRHNVGFLVLDALSPTFKPEKRHKALATRIRLHGAQVHLLKPQTFMNLSGEAVQSYAQFHHIPPENIIVIHDEADLPFGDIRTKQGGGNAGHNGLKSIQQHLGTPDFWRIRVGVGRSKNPKIPLDVHVLSPFEKDEQKELPHLFETTSQLIRDILS